MLLPIQQHITKYNYQSPVAYRNNAVPSFKGTNMLMLERLNNTLYNEARKIKSTCDPTVFFRLAMTGLAALAGVFEKIKDTDPMQKLSTEIQTNIENIKAQETTYPNTQNTNNCTQTEHLTTVPEEHSAEKANTAPQNTTKNITDKQIEIRYRNYIDEKPERKEYFIYLENYPELLKKYQNLIRKKILNECDRTRDSLNGFEKILRLIPIMKKEYYNAKDSEKDKKVNPDDLLNSLNTVYLNDFEDICSMFYKELYLQSIYKNKRKIYNILDSIAKKIFDSTVLKEYFKYPYLTYFEYTFSIKECDREDFLQYINDMKHTHEIQECRLVKSKIGNNGADFAIQFNYKINTIDRLNVIIEIFEKLNGKITLHPGLINGNGIFNMANLFDELHSRLKKDNIITPLYNFVKFISPETLKEYNYTEDELNQIFRPTEEDLNRMKDGTINPEDKERFEKFIELERKIGSAIAFLDDNEKCKVIIEIVNDKEIFQDCIDNLHAILRFICRFVINGKINPENDLKEECKKQVSALKSDIHMTTSESRLIRPYIYNNRKGIAPKFYFLDNDKCKLGNGISVTLDKGGYIHTIFKNLPINNRGKYKEED